MSLAILTNLSFAGTRLIIEFSPTPKQQQLITHAKNAQEKNSDLKTIRAQLMQKLEHAKLNTLSSAAGEKVTDFAPFALGGRVVELERTLSADELHTVIARLSKVPGVKRVEEDITLAPLSSNEVPFNSDQWPLYDFDPNSNYIERDSFTDAETTYNGRHGASFYNYSTNTFVPYKGKGITVAMLDGGYLPHPDFISHLVPFDKDGHFGYQFLTDCEKSEECPSNTPLDQRYRTPRPDALAVKSFDTWHGPKAIGIIIGQHVDEQATLGGAPEAMVLPVRVSGRTGAQISDMVAGMLWAAGLHPTILNPHPAQVINMSLGGPTGGCVPEVQEAVDQIIAHNVVIVAGAGNYKKFEVDSITPGGCKGVISAAALLPRQALTSYTTTGYGVTIAAPSGSLTTSYTGKVYPGKDCSGNKCFTYETFGGTSEASPWVSAAVADILSANPKLTPAQITQIIRDSATPFATRKDSCALNMYDPKDNLYCIAPDTGMLNVAKAIALATSSKYK